MHPKKEHYANVVYGVVEEVCVRFSDTSKDPTQDTLNLSPETVKELIQKIMIAIPDTLFYNADPDTLTQILQLISREFVLFQIQEDMESEQYAENLLNFIDSIVTSITHRL